MQWLKLAIAFFVLCTLGLAATPYGHELIEAAGQNLPKHDMAADYARGLAWALVLGLSILAWPVDRRTKASLLWLWAAKCVTALGLMLVYEWSYGLDAFAYFWLGQPGLYDPTGLAYGKGTEIVQWLSHLHWEYVLADSYHAMKLSFAYVGFVGCYLFYRAGPRDLRLLWLIALTPSVLQWSSILGKDPIAFFGIGLYCYGVARSFRGLVALVLGVLIAAATRPWLALILVAPLTGFAWWHTRRLAARVALVLGSIGAFAAALAFFSDRLQIGSIDDAVFRTELISRSFSHGGSANTSALAESNTPEKMLLFAPIGAFSALFRPLPGEVWNLFGTLSGLENLVLLGFTLFALVRARARTFRDPLVLWACMLVLVWACVYGFVSFHNMGSGARFRLQIMPVFVLLLLRISRLGLSPEECRRATPLRSPSRSS